MKASFSGMQGKQYVGGSGASRVGAFLFEEGR